MAVSYKTRLEIWSKFAGRCAICNNILLYEEDKTEVKSFVGEIAHIVAQENNGPRANPSMPQEQRDSFSNLILLCHPHHKTIDDHPDIYTVEKLNQIRSERLALIEEKLDVADFAPELDQSKYLQSCLKHIICNIDLDNWPTLYESVMEMDTPHMDELFINKLKSLRNYLRHFKEVNNFDEISKAIKNFLLVLNDFLDSSQKYVEIIYKKRWFYILPKFYHSEKYLAKDFIEDDEYPLQTDEHSFLLSKFNFYCKLIQILMNELAFAINHLLICTRNTFGTCLIPQTSDYFWQSNFLLQIGSYDNFYDAIYSKGKCYVGLHTIKDRLNSVCKTQF